MIAIADKAHRRLSGRYRQWLARLGTMTQAEISKAVGIGRGMVSRVCLDAGIAKHRKHRRFTSVEDELVNSRESVAEIARRLGRAPGTIRARRAYLARER